MISLGNLFSRSFKGRTGSGTGKSLHSRGSRRHNEGTVVLVCGRSRIGLPQWSHHFDFFLVFNNTTQVADKNKDGKISYAEFLENFREQTVAMVNSVEFDVFGDDDSIDSNDNNLVGLDAIIPGGKYDKSLSESEANGERLNAIDLRTRSE
jgi:hypothetical protein